MQDGILDPAEMYFFKQVQLNISSHEVRLPSHIEIICGVDAVYSTYEKLVKSAAALFVDGHLAETSVCSGSFTFPYVTGLFFLHEGPFVVSAIRKLQTKPQLVCFDAHGLAHPRLKGMATICGIVLGIPSIGIAKSGLVGKISAYKTGLEKMKYNHIDVGYVLSRQRKRYWSPGYSVSMSELERIITEHGTTCLRALEEAHKLSKSISKNNPKFQRKPSKVD